jgi:hypothetical protein
MRGMNWPVLAKRLVDFSTLATPGGQEIVLVDRIELVRWRELSLKIRVHSHTLTGTNTIAINVYPQSWTSEDPGMQFVAGVAATTSFGASSLSPGEIDLTVPVLGTNNIAGMARITASGSRNGVGTMQATLSMEFSSKLG